MERITQLPPLPPRPIEGHKGMFGRVLVVGGSASMIGAPVLTGTAALRSGAGLVQIAVPKAGLLACISITPELIGLPLGKSSGKGKILEEGEKADAIIIGPGLGQSTEAQERLVATVRMDKPMVVDADGLNILSLGKRWPAYFKATAVLTPHPGEMARLGRLMGRSDVPSDEQGRIDIAVEAARSFGQTLVLKGNGTVVADARSVYVNTTGDSSLSKAGTGDVLSGIIGTLLAQKMTPFDAACAGVWLHGRAGEIAGRRLGMRCVLAREVIDSLPDAIRDYESKSESHESGRIDSKRPE